jgi:hypothetical protein
MLSEELDIVSSDEMNLENEGQVQAKNRTTHPHKVSVRVQQVLHILMGERKLNAYTFTKNSGPQFHLLPDAEPIYYFSLFFNDELLNSIVVETNRNARHKISELLLSPRSIWSRWSDMSVPEMKAFLGLIINMGLMILRDIKDYWSSEWITQIKFFGDIMCRVRV